MAEYFYVSAGMVAAGGVARVPPGVSPEAAALTELVSVCWHGLGQTRFEAGWDTLVIGNGPIGLTFVQLLRLMGAARIWITGKGTHRSALADALGADMTLDISSASLATHLRRGGYAPDLAIIAAPTVDDALVALEALRPGGDLLVFSGYPHGTRMSFNLYKFHYAEKHIHGSIDATIADFHKGMELQRSLQMERLVTHRFPLDETVQAFAVGRDRQRVKILIEPSTD